MQCPPLVSKLNFEWIPCARGISRDRQKLMLVLHGRGDSASAFRSINEELRIPGMNYLLVNAPRRYDGGFTWYAFPPNQARGILLSRQLLLDLFDQLFSAGWSAKDLYLYGFSQGSLMSVDLVLNAPFTLGGAVGISGYVYFFRGWQRRLKKNATSTPLLLTHGIFDDALPIEVSREQARQLKKAQVDVIWREFNKEHEIDLDKETNFIRHWLKYQLSFSSQDRADTKQKKSFRLNLFSDSDFIV